MRKRRKANDDAAEEYRVSGTRLRKKRFAWILLKIQQQENIFYHTIYICFFFKFIITANANEAIHHRVRNNKNVTYAMLNWIPPIHPGMRSSHTQNELSHRVILFTSRQFAAL